MHNDTTRLALLRFAKDCAKEADRNHDSESEAPPRAFAEPRCGTWQRLKRSGRHRL